MSGERPSAEPIHIRKETPEDRQGIRSTHLDAFGEEHGESVATLVERIRDSNRYVSDFSLVAEKNGEVIGHVLLSYVDLVSSDDSVRRILALSPLGIAKSHQREGIGKELVDAALHAADERGEPVVVLEGVPAYYPRFGFESAPDAGIVFPDHVPSGASMVKKLNAYEPSVQGRVRYPEAYDHLEQS